MPIAHDASTATKKCLLCGGPPFIIGTFTPVGEHDSRLMRSLVGNGKTAAYFLCRRCVVDERLPEMVMSRLLEMARLYASGIDTN